MSAFREPGKINKDTTLLDIGMQGTYGMTAVYLIAGEKTCLIDGGTRTEAHHLVQMLSALDAFPPDYVIPTHPHWDHSQGIPLLRQEASRRGKKIEVLASHDAVSLLADASFNRMFNCGPYESIQDVTPLKEGDTVDLGGITLRIYDVPGHCRGHIAILDEVNHTIFVGDALGDKVADDIYLPGFMPPTWDPDAFQSSIDKLRGIPYQALCLAHFGCIEGSEAQTILDEAVSVWRTWWQFYERHAARLSDSNYLLQAMRQELKPGLPDLRPTSTAMRLLLPLVTAAGTLIGKKTAIIDKLAYGDVLQWLATGYQTYTASQ
jgi:glyoxylase-like metal-dependent hydrolase (beta-lactamase superfamily II)